LAFAKLQKSTVSYVMSVACLFVRPPGWYHSAPAEGISWNFIFDYFSKFCRENSSFLKVWKKWRLLYL